MTPERINTAIAEWCGWKWYRRPASGPWAKKPMRCLYHPELIKPLELELADMTERECNWAFIEREGMIPNYHSDLNAIHEAEKNLTEKQQVWYLQRLTQVRYRAGVSGMIACMVDKTTFATAPQRCEA